ncbi:MAG: hypothetical protein P8048_04450 [Calditrichia bacterium]
MTYFLTPDTLRLIEQIRRTQDAAEIAIFFHSRMSCSGQAMREPSSSGGMDRGKNGNFLINEPVNIINRFSLSLVNLLP